MTTTALTDRTIKSLELPLSGQVTVWDEALSGFGVRISQGGTKSFVVVYGPNRKRKTLGRYPTISLKQARDQARTVLAEFTLGVERNRSITWAKARELFLSDCERKNKPNTVIFYRRRLDKHFKFGKQNLSDLSRQDIQSKIRRIKTSTSEQHQAFVAIRTLLNWAVREEYLGVNPVGSMKGYKPPKAREHVLSEEELAEVYSKAVSAPYSFGNIVSLLILTGMRRTEVSNLRWSWIDTVDQTITVPHDHTKNGKTLVFPYSQRIHDVLERTPHIDDLLFPSIKGDGKPFNGWGKSKERFDRTLEDVEPYTLHDLRRTFATTHAKIGTPIHVTEKLLNHISGTISGVAAVYNRHSYVEEMKAATVAYDSYLENLLNP